MMNPIITSGRYCSPEMYLVNNTDVVEITPIEIQHTNIGEPYRDLARFIFCIEGQEEDDSVDIDPDDLKDLVNMFNGLGWASNIDIPEKLARYLDSYYDE